MNKKIAVAMSGGIDSSLTAAILLERGFDVFGVTMLLDDDEKNIFDARKVCEHLGINHHVADFRKIFRAKVEDYFVAEYLRGRTPNPCVRCNREIKFGALFDFVTNLGADYLSTGHYARIIFEDGRFKLKKAVDAKKDQSYVLYNLTAEKLSRIILPLGEFSKVDTRRLAEEKNLPVANKPDSQEICFVPNDDYKNFIAAREPTAKALQPGNIVDADGKILGYHHGVANYTIGQRKGLGIAAPNPLYVTRLDVASSQVVVGTGDKLFSRTLTASDVHWIYKPTFPKILHAKIRYGSRVAQCTVDEADENFLRVTFAESMRAVTPGQSIVFYDGDEVLGGAIIFCA
ncbi:MAG: tRNA 2-thiouridine(34) synthase MnmA [Selenomonadaceae bacterium]|nr:tRNA 2-thiouridine(34) synthase MnmA [Selenomonadaceae bacterium]